MKSPLLLLTEHPASVGETYTRHLASATGFSLRMIGAGLACLIHGLLPFLFVKTGSNAIVKLHGRMVLDRARHTPTSTPRPCIDNAEALPTR